MLALLRARFSSPVPPACLLDPSLGSHEYVTANGIKFHCVSAGDRSKPLMLFLHGFPEVMGEWSGEGGGRRWNEKKREGIGVGKEFPYSYSSPLSPPVLVLLALPVEGVLQRLPRGGH